MPKIDIIETELFSTVLEEATEALQYLIKNYGETELYGFVLCADNDVTSVYPAANTLTGWNSQCEENVEDVKYYKTESRYRNFYKWYANEWRIRVPDEYNFKKTTKLLYPESSTDETGEEFLIRKRMVIEIIDKSLAEARKQILGQRENLAVLLIINDAEEYEKRLIIEAATPFNSESVIAELCSLYGLS